MDKPVLTISMQSNSTQEEIAAMRQQYNNKYKVNIIVSGNKNPKDLIKNFLKARLET